MQRPLLHFCLFSILFNITSSKETQTLRMCASQRLTGPMIIYSQSLAVIYTAECDKLRPAENQNTENKSANIKNTIIKCFSYISYI